MSRLEHPAPEANRGEHGDGTREIPTQEDGRAYEVCVHANQYSMGRLELWLDRHYDSSVHDVKDSTR